MDHQDVAFNWGVEIQNWCLSHSQFEPEGNCGEEVLNNTGAELYQMQKELHNLLNRLNTQRNN